MLWFTCAENITTTFTAVALPFHYESSNRSINND